MNFTQVLSCWSKQSSYTRIATSVSFAAALMVAFYSLVSYGPSLVDAHSQLLSFFETDKEARTAIANFAIWFSLAMQVVLALACAHAARNLTGREKLNHSSLLLLWIGHAFVLALAAIAMGMASYSRAALAALEGPNWALFWQMCSFVAIFLVAYLVPFCNSSEAAKDNPIFAFAMGKMLLLLWFASFVPTKVTMTLLVGSYILDFLLHPVGEKIAETTAR